MLVEHHGGLQRRAPWDRGPGTREHLLAVGDSHSNALISAYRAIAEQRHWRIDVAGAHRLLPATTAEQWAPSQAYTDTCQGWKRAATAWITTHADELDGVVVTHATTKSLVIVPAGSTNEATVVDGLVGAWRAATDNGVPVVAIWDNPVARPDTLDCLAQMRGPTTTACDLPRAQATASFDGSQQAASRIGAMARYVDMTDWYCTADSCPAVIGGVVVTGTPRTSRRPTPPRSHRSWGPGSPALQ